ncbi:MAG: hypothetical protein IKB50_02175 [Clostridia bacterium]|nr:hypothetical protein [Clostridia bacterium]
MNTIIAICPFCRNYIKADPVTKANTHSVYSADDVSKILKNTENKITCDRCGKEFYHEHCCRIVNAGKGYVILSLPQISDNPPTVKAALYQLLRKENFRFRYVREFLLLTEKVRIFEHGLDDRVIELIKYNCVPDSGDNKIILTGIDENSMTFTVYDGYDTPLSSHRVNKDAYHTYRKELKDEIITNTTVQWMEINLRWAEKYTKENLKP